MFNKTKEHLFIYYFFLRYEVFIQNILLPCAYVVICINVSAFQRNILGVFLILI